MDFDATQKLVNLSGRSLRTHVQELATLGFNVLRMPLTVELVHDWMNGDESPAVFTELVDASQELGVKIILVMQGVERGDESHSHPVWFTEQFTVDHFVDAWQWLAEQYKDNDTIIAFDLHGQPHGWQGQPPDDSPIQPDPEIYACWGDPEGADPECPDQLNWPNVARTTADQVHSIHPDILIMVAGVEFHESAGTPSSTPEYGLFWRGGNLSGVNEYPITISRPEKLLYTTRLTGPALHPDRGWFKNSDGDYDFSYAGLYNRKWKYAFGFISEQLIAPVFIGEWGSITAVDDLDGQFSGQEALINQSLAWLEAVTSWIATSNASHAWWAYKPGSVVAGGLVNDNWSGWDEAKLEILLPTLWQVEDRFVGLDHRIDLFNGTNIATISGVNPASDTPVLR